ncbi:MAG: hypothetical protein JRF40_14410 [Deltaproteobacteria bacterium]|nr:hypothetical protein [Deltaproteobacteria bacterium]
MIAKSQILPQRVRKVPKSFSWIDHRLVSDRHIERCSHAAATLYLFLVCVGDDKGLSYYGDQSIMDKLPMDQQSVNKARSEKNKNNLIAWQKPIYQVLCLEPFVDQRKRGEGTAMSLGDILKKAMEGTK